MEMICPHCGVSGSADDSLLGRRVKCPKCGSIFGITAEMVQPIQVNDDEIEELLDENEISELEEVEADHFADGDADVALTSHAEEDLSDPELAELLEDDMMGDVSEGEEAASEDDENASDILGDEGEEGYIPDVDAEAFETSSDSQDEEVDEEAATQEDILEDGDGEISGETGLEEEEETEAESVSDEESSEAEDEASEYEKQESEGYVPPEDYNESETADITQEPEAEEESKKPSEFGSFLKRLFSR